MLFPLLPLPGRLKRIENRLQGVEARCNHLENKVKIMSQAQDQVTADLATIKSQVATMAANYTAAGAAGLTKALADAKAAWDADDDAKWNAAHASATDIINTMTAGQPITPPATSSDPSPAPVPAPSADASGAAAGAGTAQN